MNRPVIQPAPTRIAVAVVRDGDRVLIGQRRPDAVLAGLWEFPGGKVQEGESLQEAAARECREETGLAVEVGELLETVEHAYPHGLVRITFFAAAPVDPKQSPTAGFCWAPTAGLGKYAFPPANRAVLARLTGVTM